MLILKNVEIYLKNSLGGTGLKIDTNEISLSFDEVIKIEENDANEYMFETKNFIIFKKLSKYSLERLIRYFGLNKYELVDIKGFNGERTGIFVYTKGYKKNLWDYYLENAYNLSDDEIEFFNDDNKAVNINDEFVPCENISLADEYFAVKVA